MRRSLIRLHFMRRRIARDPELRAFLEGRSRRLPGFYHECLRARLGPYLELLSREDLRPELEAPAARLTQTESRLKLLRIDGR